MKYFFIEGTYIPNHCLYGPRLREAILLNDSEWYRVNDYLHKSEREVHIAEMLSMKEKNKKEFSLNMTRNWQNTLASIKTQSEQRRMEKKEKLKQDRIDAYNRILEERKNEKAVILREARKKLFSENDRTKAIISALLQGATVKEWEKQIELKNVQKAEEIENIRLYSDYVLKDAEKYKQEQEELVKKAKEEKNVLRKNFDKQCENNGRKVKEEKEQRKLIEDKIKMRQVEEKLQHCEKERNKKLKQITMLNLKKELHRLELSKKIEKEEAKEEEDIRNIYLKYADKFKEERLKKEESILNESLETREKTTNYLCSKLAKETVNADELLEKAIREKEEADIKRQQDEEEHKRQLKAQLRQWAIEQKRKNELSSDMEKEAFKWSILQMYRMIEVDKLWKEEKKKKEKEEKEKYTQDLAKQIREKDAYLEEEKKRDMTYREEKFSGKNEMLKYCQDALDLAKTKGWKLEPLLNVIKDIRKEYGEEEENEAKDGTQKEEPKARKRLLGPGCYCFRN